MTNLEDIPDEVIDMTVQAIQLHNRALRRKRERLAASERDLILDTERETTVAHQAMVTWQSVQAERDKARAKAS